MGNPDELERLNREIVACTRCARLITHCTLVAKEKRRAYRDQVYWGKPVPGFGDRQARVLALGLAPGAHGSNRTGRMFTGDGSGNFLYPILHQAGFASQASSSGRDDGMELTDLYITAMARCAPPGNKPLPQELASCSEFLDRELAELKDVRVVVALGKIAFDGYLAYLKRRGLVKSRAGYGFGHGACFAMPDGRTLLASYHPSMQNTLTGKLTAPMLLSVFQQAKKMAQGAAPPQGAAQAALSQRG